MNNTTTIGPVVREAAGWSMLCGILMFICGILAITLPLASSAGIVIVLAWLIICTGIWHLIFAFQSRGSDALLWQLLLALLYESTGFYMLLNPLLSVFYPILAAFLLIEGSIEIAFYFDIRNLKQAGWVLFDGIITFVLGGLIWARWPSAAAWVIGALVGISLIGSGLSRFMLGLAVRKFAPGTAAE